MLHHVHFRNTIYDGPAPAASRELEDDGVSLVRGLLTPDEVRALRAEIVEVYEQTPPDHRIGSPSPEHADQFRYEMFNRSARCQALLAHPRLLAIVEPLLGPNCHVIACTAWRNPADPSLTPNGQEWHTDAGPHIPRSPDVEWPADIPYPVFAIAVHVFLDACGPADGPTAFVPKSHKSGLAPPKEREWDLELEHRGERSRPVLAEPGDVALFVSDVWHRRLPPTERSTGRFFLQINYARRDLAQRVLPTARVNHTSPEARERARTEREQQLIGLHVERFYDG